MIQNLIREYGKIDILVNNAGITRDNLIMKMSEEDFDLVIGANLKGCFNTIKAASRQMLKQRAGRIINIASVSGRVQALASVDGKIVAARQENQLVTAFHPELNDDPRVHRYFLEMIAAQKRRRAL